MKTTFILKGLNCPNCSEKILRDIRKYDGMKSAEFDLGTQKLSMEHEEIKDLKNKVENSVNKFEKGVTVLEKKKINENKNINVKENGVHHSHEHGEKNCCEGHSHKHLHAHSHEHNHEDIDEDSHGHSHEHGNLDASEKKKTIAIFAVVFGLLIFNHFYDYNKDVKRVTYLLAYVLVGYEVVISAFRNIFHGEFFDEEFLMTLATFAAIGIGEYPEAVAVMLFYSVGEFLQDLALDRSRDNIKAALELKPEFANVVGSDGVVTKFDPEDVEVGSIIVVKPGEKVPLYGKIIEGDSYLDTSEITGESVPVKVSIGDEIESGSINKSNILKMEVTKAYEEGAIAKVIDLVENASTRKARVEKLITRFSKVYTPIVCVIALLMVLFGPRVFSITTKVAIYRACVFLVLSCPCAFIISVPLGIFGGIGAASKNGVFVKGGNFLEGLKDVKTFVFDKTGTITKGVFEVSDVKTYGGFKEDEVIKIAAIGEHGSNHPIAKAIVAKYGKDIDINEAKDFEEIPGKGIKFNYKDGEVLVGNASLVGTEKKEGTNVFVKYMGEIIGDIIVSDIVKDEAKSFVSDLKSMGIKAFMLSGDEKSVTEKIAKEVGIDNSIGGLLPEDKVKELEKIKNSTDGKVAFVGDGVNDSPVIALSDIGIAMGMRGSDIAIEASDIVIMKDELEKIVDGIKISKYTAKIVTQNIVFALSVKLIVLILASIGHASIWAGVFADVGVTLIAVLNSLRALNPKIN